jgi:hypothetical protein
MYPGRIFHAAVQTPSQSPSTPTPGLSKDAVEATQGCGVSSLSSKATIIFQEAPFKKN